MSPVKQAGRRPGPRKRAVVNRKRPKPRRWPWFGLLLAFAALAILPAAAYVYWLDRQVGAQFEGKRWALPARVYARPLELYDGLALRPDNLIAELTALNYRAHADGTAPGSYLRRGDFVRLTSRGFRFSDGVEQSRTVELHFAANRLVSLSAAGRPLPLLRLEPALIGGIYPAHGEDRVLLRLDEVPPALVHALVAIEDREFFQHRGISFSGIGRAAWANLRARRVVQGGSTITQQLVKNFYLSDERSLRRKVNEAVMALLLEYRYDKAEIFEAYLNEIYLAQDGNRGIHGFGLGAEYYFGRPLAELELHQVALLVALVRGPSFYNPRRHPQRARERRDRVLRQLAADGLIDQPTLRRALAQELELTATAAGSANRYPAFMDLVRQHLRRDYRAEDLSSDGLQIFTTLVPHVQEAAQRTVSRRLAALDPQLEAAAVVVDIDDGTVAALVGGRHGQAHGFNRALQARRQVGSLLKPAVYLTALARPRHYGLGSLLSDGPLEVRDAGDRAWQPKNYDGRFYGQVPLWQALANSYNLATVSLGMELGLRAVVDSLTRLGLQPPAHSYPSLLLGAVDYTPLEVAQMYQTIAAGGYRSPLRGVQAVMTADGELLQSYPLALQQAFGEGEVYLLRYALEQAMSSGTGRSAAGMLPEGLRVAGKTGTTDGTRDSWFAGYSADRLGVIWLGHDDNRSTGLTGAAGALQVWSELWARLDARSLEVRPPAGVELAWIERGSGMSAAQHCAGTMQLPYLQAYLPPPSSCIEDAAPGRGLFRDWGR